MPDGGRSIPDGGPVESSGALALPDGGKLTDKFSEDLSLSYLLQLRYPGRGVFHAGRGVSSEDRLCENRRDLVLALQGTLSRTGHCSPPDGGAAESGLFFLSSSGLLSRLFLGLFRLV